MCPERTTPHVIKSNHKAAALNNSGHSQQKDARMNGFLQ